jgi:Tannase and feruloyl esterase
MRFRRMVFADFRRIARFGTRSAAGRPSHRPVARRARGADVRAGFLAPGIDHCFFASVSGTNPPAPGGHVDNPNVGLIDVLQRWVEHDEAPEQITATSAPGVTPARTRPWCPYPKRLRYLSGDVNTGSFTCE